MVNVKWVRGGVAQLVTAYNDEIAARLIARGAVEKFDGPVPSPVAGKPRGPATIPAEEERKKGRRL
jgi:hypothetical protein